MSHPHPDLDTPAPLAPGGVRVTPLGGLGEVGRNMTVLEHDGQLLVIDYNVIEELPADLGMTVISQKWGATADVLYNVKADAEEKHRAKHGEKGAFDLRQTRGGDFPSLPGATAAAPLPPLGPGEGKAKDCEPFCPPA